MVITSYLMERFNYIHFLCPRAFLYYLAFYSVSSKFYLFEMTFGPIEIMSY